MSQSAGMGCNGVYKHAGLLMVCAGKLQQVTELMNSLEQDLKEKTLTTQRKSVMETWTGSLFVSDLGLCRTSTDAVTAPTAWHKSSERWPYLFQECTWVSYCWVGQCGMC